MDNIKVLACKTPILWPIDPTIDEPIWVICNASASGVGAVYGQGQSWQTVMDIWYTSHILLTHSLARTVSLVVVGCEIIVCYT